MAVGEERSGVDRRVWPLAAIALATSLQVGCGGAARDPSGGTSSVTSGQPAPGAPTPASPAAPSEGSSPVDAAPPASPSGAGATPDAPAPPAMGEPAPMGGPDPSPSEAPPAPSSTPPDAPAEAPPASISVEGCHYIGGYDRVFIFQRDEALGICTDLTLVSTDEAANAFDLSNLSLPPRWTVDDMVAFACTPDRQPVAGSQPNYYTTASGEVSFEFAPGAQPLRASLDVALTLPADDPALYPVAEPRIEAQQIRVEGLELQGSCPPL